MFTGLIEEIGSLRKIVRCGGYIQADFKACLVLDGTKPGDSIAVNGVCQTVVSLDDEGFITHVTGETLKKTTMGSLNIGEAVNLERAMSLGDRIGGHLVQGHVSNRGKIKSIGKEGEAYRVTVSIPQDLMKYLIDEGSVAIDGISLTAAAVNKQKNEIVLQIIPHTFLNTILKFKKTGDEVNVETDLMGRYAESLLFQTDAGKGWGSRISEWGY